MPFDVEGARRAGYTDAEIADHLAQQGGFDATGARKRGYTDADIIGHLTGATPHPEPSPIDDRTGARLSHRFIIGSANDDATKLERARALYGNSAQPEADGRISFVNPDTGRRTYVNPSGFDAGDLFGSGREIASAVATLPFDASVVGIPAAAAVGAGVGEAADSLAAMLARYEAGKRGNAVPKMQGVGDAAKDAAVETALGTVGGGAMLGLGRAAKHVANPIKESAVDAWQALGLPTAPSLAMAGKGRGVKAMEAGVGNTIFGADQIDDATQRGRQAIAGYIGRLGNDIADGNVMHTPQQLGQFVRAAAKESRDVWDAQAIERERQLYGQFGNDPAALTSVKMLLEDKAGTLSKSVAGERIGPLAKLVSSGIADGGNLNINSVLALKQKVGALLKNEKAATSLGLDGGDLKQLYGALGQDIEMAVRDPAKLMELRDFNAWYSKEKLRRDTLEATLFPQGDRTLPEYTGAVLLNPKVSPTTMQVLENVIDPQAYQAVRGSMVSKLGRPRSSSGIPEGEVSPETLLTQIHSSDGGMADGAMHPEVRQQLFGGLMDPARRAAEAMRDAGRSGNASGTSRVSEAMRLIPALAGAGYGLSQGDVGDAVTFGGGALLLPAALARAHTSPAVINYLARGQGNVSRAITDSLLPRAGVIGGLMSAPNQ